MASFKFKVPKLNKTPKMKEKESIWWTARQFHIHFLRKPTCLSVNGIFKRAFLLLTVCFTQQPKPEPIKVIEITQWALKCTIISFNKACPVFFISLQPNKNKDSDVTIWIAETVNSSVAKVIWETTICGVPYLLKHYQVHRTFCICNTFTEKVFRT